jgi:hypothetical protein
VTEETAGCDRTISKAVFSTTRPLLGQPERIEINCHSKPNIFIVCKSYWKSQADLVSVLTDQYNAHPMANPESALMRCDIDHLYEFQ